MYERIAKAVNDKNFHRIKISVWEGFPGGFGTDGPNSNSVVSLEEPIAFVKGLEERGAQYFVQSAGSPSITAALTQAETASLSCILYPTFQKALKEAVKPETVLSGQIILFGVEEIKIRCANILQRTICCMLVPEI